MGGLSRLSRLHERDPSHKRKIHLSVVPLPGMGRAHMSHGKNGSSAVARSYCVQSGSVAVYLFLPSVAGSELRLLSRMTLGLRGRSRLSVTGQEHPGPSEGRVKTAQAVPEASKSMGWNNTATTSACLLPSPSN